MVDTNYANFLAYSEAINFVLNQSITYNPERRFSRQTLLEVFPNLTEEEFKLIVEKKESCYEKYLQKTKLNKTIHTILNRYHKVKRTFLVTNCRKNRALMILRYYRIEGKFEKTFCREHAGSGKASKYENAISILAISPEIVTVFEDEHDGVADAIRAGIPADNIVIVK